jgi:hypothetical protein
MRRDDRGDAELLTAYVDGVAELSLEERKRVDDLLARDPALRDAERETRELVGALRELPPVGSEPDWNALERSIGDAVGKDVPVPWYARWRWIVPTVALATTAAIIALVVHDPKPAPQPPAPIVKDEQPVVPHEEEEVADVRAALPLMLDGTDLEVAIEAAELFDLEWDLDEESVPETAELLPPTDLEWIDELDGESLDHVDRMLEQRPRRGRT